MRARSTAGPSRAIATSSCWRHTSISGCAAEALDLVPVRAFDHPRAAHADDVAQREIVRRVAGMDPAGGAEAHLWERPGEGLQRLDAAHRLGGEELAVGEPALEQRD